MRIFFLTQYYPPESGACQNRISYFAKALSRSGHDVTVLTAMPNYPSGTIFEQYSGRPVLTERLEHVQVMRTWLYTSTKSTFMRRLASYLSFCITSLIAGLLQAERPDVIITESPPLFLGITGLLLSKVKGAKHVFNVSDLWPESAVAMGVIERGIVCRAAVRLEEFLYDHADLITGQTQGIVTNIQPRSTGVPVALLTNGIDLSELFPQSSGPDAERVRAQLGIGNEFVVGYFGLHGLGQGLDTALEAANLLRNNHQVLFVFFGDGPEKPGLIRKADALGLRNVRFHDSRTAAQIPEIMRAVNASLVPLKNLPLFRGALPSKLFTSMGAGLPVIAAVEGEARHLVETAQAGICVQPENAPGLASAILQLAARPELGRRLGQNGVAYVREHYDRQRIAAELETLLIELVPPQRSKVKRETDVLCTVEKE